MEIAIKDANKLKEDLETEKNRMQKERESIISMQGTKVKLDVGGHVFTTTISTLTKYEDSMLAHMFSGLFTIQKDEQGCIFIDRDGSHFRYILNYLRDGRVDLPDDPLIFNEIKREAEYYQLMALAQQIASSGVPGVDTNTILGTSLASEKTSKLDEERILHYDNVTVFTGHTGAVRCLDLVGNVIVSGSDDKTIRMWNIETSECFKVIVGHTDSVLCLQYAENDYLVSGSYDKYVFFYFLFKLKIKIKKIFFTQNLEQLGFGI